MQWNGHSHGPTLIITDILVPFHLITIFFCVFFCFSHFSWPVSQRFIYVVNICRVKFWLCWSSLYLFFISLFFFYVLSPFTFFGFGCSFPNFSNEIPNSLFSVLKTHLAAFKASLKEQTFSTSYRFSYAFSLSFSSVYLKCLTVVSYLLTHEFFTCIYFQISKY